MAVRRFAVHHELFSAATILTWSVRLGTKEAEKDSTESKAGSRNFEPFDHLSADGQTNRVQRPAEAGATVEG